MSSPLNDKTRDTKATDRSGLELPTGLLLSLATGPMLLGVLSLESLFSALQATGISSEEVFRGERLPLLPFPDINHNG